MRTRAGIRGGRQLANTFRKMGDAPTPAMRAKAREEALKITTGRRHHPDDQPIGSRGRAEGVARRRA
jgi:hypothetical protein